MTPGVEDENSEGRLIDMDTEGRDLDFIFPGMWASSLTGLYDQDVTLAEGMYRAYHNYMDDLHVGGARPHEEQPPGTGCGP